MKNVDSYRAGEHPPLVMPTTLSDLPTIRAKVDPDSTLPMEPVMLAELCAQTQVSGRRRVLPQGLEYSVHVQAALATPPAAHAGAQLSTERAVSPAERQRWVRSQRRPDAHADPGAVPWYEPGDGDGVAAWPGQAWGSAAAPGSEHRRASVAACGPRDRTVSQCWTAGWGAVTPAAPAGAVADRPVMPAGQSRQLVTSPTATAAGPPIAIAAEPATALAAEPATALAAEPATALAAEPATASTGVQSPALVPEGGFAAVTPTVPAPAKVGLATASSPATLVMDSLVISAGPVLGHATRPAAHLLPTSARKPSRSGSSHPAAAPPFASTPSESEAPPAELPAPELPQTTALPEKPPAPPSPSRPAAELDHGRTPRLLTGSKPQLPPLVRQMYRRDAVVGTYRVCVQPGGTVASVTAVSGIPFDEEIRRTLHSWRFAPRATPACVDQELHFEVDE